MLRRAARTVKWIGIFGILTFLAIFAFLSIEHRSEVSLPTPTGPFAVGRAIYDWTDDSASDPAAPSPQGKREILAWIWYPAIGQPSASSDCVPASVRPPESHPGIVARLFGLLTRDKVRCHAIDNAEISPSEHSYPVVIMRGGASAPVVNYSTLAEDLASHGYAVVGIDAPYRTSRVIFPDGRVIYRNPENNPELVSGAELNKLADKLMAAWVADMRFAINQITELGRHDPARRFTGRLDLTRVGAFGHSFGGAQAAQFCHDDARCKAGVDIDGAPVGSVIRDGLTQPFMFLLSDHGSNPSDAESKEIISDIHAIYDRLPPNKRALAVISGAFHFTFSDDGALLKSRLTTAILRVFGKLKISGPRQ
ncbi:MAG TPA: family membership, partial [Candidatus Dormibacteraeota bacterium]|nr:family membership [Candidatus Dormibacteraeota bacterium]